MPINPSAGTPSHNIHTAFQEPRLALAIDQLNEWSQEGSPAEQRVQANFRIQYCHHWQQAALDLSNLGLSNLPAMLAQLNSVTELNLANNSLSELPEWLHQHTRLIGLNLSNNQIHTLPHNFWDNKAKLQYLDLYNNQLVTLPGPIPQVLTFQLNEHTVPQAFEGLSLDKHPHVHWMNVGKNQLETLPETMNYFACLQNLFAQENRISSLPASIFKTPELHQLDLTLNPLYTLPRFEGPVCLRQQKNPCTLVLDQASVNAFSGEQLRNCPMKIQIAH